MGRVLRIGGSNYGWYRLDHGPNGLGLSPPNGGNCRESWGIVRNYDQPGVRAAVQDILDRFRDEGQCWIRTVTFFWLNAATGTFVDISTGQVTNPDLNRLVNFLTDIHDRGFRLNFSYFWFDNTNARNWNGWQAVNYARVLSTVQQLQPIIDQFSWPELQIDLGNEMQAASNESAETRRFGWQIYRDFGNSFGVANTNGPSISFGAGNPGLSRYQIQYIDQNDPTRGLHGTAPILDVHGYATLSDQNTNWLALLDNLMTQNGDTRDIRIGESFYSNHATHVAGLHNNIAQLNRDVEFVLQWPLSQFGNCTDVDIVDTVEFNYNGEPCTELDCANSQWGN